MGERVYGLKGEIMSLDQCGNVGILGFLFNNMLLLCGLPKWDVAWFKWWKAGGYNGQIDWKVSNGIGLWDEWASKRAFFFNGA